MTTDAIKQANAAVAEVRALFDDLEREMQRRVNLEIALLRATPEFRLLLREFVAYCASRPKDRHGDR